MNITIKKIIECISSNIQSLTLQGIIYIQDLKVKELHEDYLPEHIGRFEKRAAANGTGWIWGDKVCTRMHTMSKDFLQTC